MAEGNSAIPIGVHTVCFVHICLVLQTKYRISLLGFNKTEAAVSCAGYVSSGLSFHWTTHLPWYFWDWHTQYAVANTSCVVHNDIWHIWHDMLCKNTYVCLKILLIANVSICRNLTHIWCLWNKTKCNNICLNYINNVWQIGTSVCKTFGRMFYFQ